MIRFAHRSLLPSVCALGLILSGVACSSKPAEPDTAEVTPDPAIKPAPAPAPAPTTAPEGVTSAPPAHPAPAPEAKP